MATHRFFTVNGRPVDVPSYLLKPGDVVAARESKHNSSYFSNFEKRLQNSRPPSWITLSPKAYSFTVADSPSYEEANLGVDIRAVVEYFAR
jgi:small subunit ribosomal protein S4